MKILVTGVAGDIGLGIGRILRDWNFFDTIQGIDISKDHPASLIFDKIDLAPRADDDDYLDWLLNYLKSHKINILVPTSEAEIQKISQNLDVFDSHCKVLINDIGLIDKSLDKAKTLTFLESFGIHVPSHGIVCEADKPKKYPVIAKPRSGQGSKGLQKIFNDLEFSQTNEGFVWQAYLVPDDEEYTCAVYVSKSLDSRILILKRVLIGGYTGKAVVVKDKKIKDYVKEIISAFNVAGAYNIQLRLTADGPKIFEINPRISSTVVFRDKLGFEDFKWWVLETLGQELPVYEDIAAGTKIYRGNTEYIIKEDEAL